MWPLCITAGMQICEIANYIKLAQEVKSANLLFSSQCRNADLLTLQNRQTCFSVCNAEMQICKFTDIAKSANLLFSLQCRNAD